ncbi:hypothetical protein [Haloarcula litorea]|uniref:hypothetical protein n=1 Tax=Haloarcula litorea TaxID=3032579 RepID=UPI0023E8C948|nr:hypothetical protein [Halomicroarcula sp. GDY20]
MQTRDRTEGRGERTTTYECGGCGVEYRVVGDEQPVVVCPDCGVRATLTGDAGARREYTVGRAKYREGRRRLSVALAAYEDGDQPLARGDFDDAAGDFEEAVDHFTTAVRRAESRAVGMHCDTARKKATCLWQAAQWLSGASWARERGDETRAAEFQHDARNRLQAAARYEDPPEPDALGES